ncbi:MAG: DUF2958 domain-containing protein [Oligoflexia bacterium]|nr:DUF2958 domain-containing protein [Oligoflexia bacterium]
MELIPAEIAATLPALYATENNTDPIAIVKLFHSPSGWRWYVCEYSKEERICFGLVIGFVSEKGYFSIEELEEIEPFRVERDLFWKPKSLSQVEAKLNSTKHR